MEGKVEWALADTRNPRAKIVRAAIDLLFDDLCEDVARDVF